MLSLGPQSCYPSHRPLNYIPGLLYIFQTGLLPWVSQGRLELAALLPQPPKCRGNRTVPLGLPPPVALSRLRCVATLRALKGGRRTRLLRQEHARWSNSRKPAQLVIFSSAYKGKDAHLAEVGGKVKEEEDDMKYMVMIMIIVQVNPYRALIMH